MSDLPGLTAHRREPNLFLHASVSAGSPVIPVRAPPMLKGSDGREICVDLGCRTFPTYSPRQGDEVAINPHKSLSGGHYRLIEESFNSSLAHKKRL